MNEEKVKEAVCQLTTAFAMAKDARTTLEQEGFYPISMYGDFDKDCKVMLLNKGKFAEHGIEAISELFGTEIVNAVRFGYLYTELTIAGVRYYHIEEDKGNGTVISENQ